MTKAEALARIDAELAALRALTPDQVKEFDRMLQKAHRLQHANDMTRKVLGK